jgi:hypothetical protein
MGGMPTGRPDQAPAAIWQRAGQRPRTYPAAIRPSSNAAVPVVTTGSRAAKSQCLFVIGLDNREAVRVGVSEDRPEYDHVVTFEVRAPVSSIMRDPRLPESNAEPRGADIL